MSKEEKPLFIKAFIIVVVILLANIGAFFWKYVDLSKGLTGNAIAGNLMQAYTSMPGSVKIFLIGEWAFLIMLLGILFVRDVRIRKREFSDINFNVHDKSGTDLDALYSILKDKKQIKVSSIAKAFKIDRETAMEWCRILESGNLATIDYPGVGEPIIRLV